MNDNSKCNKGETVRQIITVVVQCFLTPFAPVIPQADGLISSLILVIILSLLHLPGGQEQIGAPRFLCVSIKLYMHPALLLWYGWDIKKERDGSALLNTAI